jgi:hypothetical protein
MTPEVKSKKHHRPNIVYWDQQKGSEFYHDLKIARRLGTTVAPAQHAGMNAAKEVERNCKIDYKECEATEADLAKRFGTPVSQQNCRESFWPLSIGFTQVSTPVNI